MIVLCAVILSLYSVLALVSTLSSSTTTAIIAYSAMSSATFFVYYIYNAADVALTEISIGFFLTFFFFYIVHFKTHIRPPEHKKTIETIFLCIISSCIFVLFIYISYILDSVSLETTYSQYYNNNTYKQTHVANTITAILASYRGFDTLGETLIIAISSLGIATILKKKK